MSNIPVIIDIILLIIISMCAIKAFKKGFFAAAIDLLGKLAGLGISWIIANKYSPVIFDSFFKNKMVENTLTYLQNSANTIDVNEILNGFSGIIPEKFMQELTTIANDIIFGMVNPDISVAEEIVDAIIAPIVIIVISVIVFTICVIIFNILVSVLSKFLKVLNHIPIIGLANRICGAVVGVLQGAIYVILISCIMSIIAIITQNSLEFLNIELLSQSKILAMTSFINPFMG